jgi:hypothetical protein
MVFGGMADCGKSHKRVLRHEPVRRRENAGFAINPCVAVEERPFQGRVKTLEIGGALAPWLKFLSGLCFSATTSAVPLIMRL